MKIACKTYSEEMVKTHKVGLFPGNLISNNHNQFKMFVKCPFCFLFLLKMAPEMKQTNKK